METIRYDPRETMTAEQVINDLGNRVMSLETAITGLNLADGRTTAQVTIDVEARVGAIEREFTNMKTMYDQIIDSKIQTAIQCTKQKSYEHYVKPILERQSYQRNREVDGREIVQAMVQEDEECD